jgi:hypothetical protein
VLTRSSHSQVLNNYLNNNADNGGDININNTSTAIVSDISVEGNTAGEIIVHATGSGAEVHDVVIAANHLYPGQNSKTEFGIEFGDFEPATGCPANPCPSLSHVTNITLTNNVVKPQSAATHGGYSCSVASNITETGDVFDNSVGQFAYTVQAFEHAMCDKMAVSGISADAGGAGSGFDFNRTSHSSLTASTVRNVCATCNAFLQTVAANAYFDHVNQLAIDNQITGNYFGGNSAGTTFVVFLQTAATAGDTIGNSILANNTIDLNGATGEIGIKMLQGAGSSCNGWYIYGNTIMNGNVGFVNTSCTNVFYKPGYITGVTIPYGNSTQTNTDFQIVWATATAALTAGQLVKWDGANDQSVVIETKPPSNNDPIVGFVINSPGAGNGAFVFIQGIYNGAVVGTGTCTRGQFVHPDTTTNGRVKCDNTYVAGTQNGEVASGNAIAVGSTIPAINVRRY